MNPVRRNNYVGKADGASPAWCGGVTQFNISGAVCTSVRARNSGIERDGRRATRAAITAAVRAGLAASNAIDAGEPWPARQKGVERAPTKVAPQASSRATRGNMNSGGAWARSDATLDTRRYDGLSRRTEIRMFSPGPAGREARTPRDSCGHQRQMRQTSFFSADSARSVSEPQSNELAPFGRIVRTAHSETACSCPRLERADDRDNSRPAPPRQRGRVPSDRRGIGPGRIEREARDIGRKPTSPRAPGGRHLRAGRRTGRKKSSDLTRR